MMLGMSLSTFTFVHVLLSLVGIAAGFVVVAGFITARRLDTWTAIFLTTTVLTSVTGFGFPFKEFLPSHAIGILSLLILAPAIAARYTFRLAGLWRPVYVIGSVVALYFNTFVLVVQSFHKIPALHELAPTDTEPAFAAAHTVVLLLFIGIGILATRRFRVDALQTA